MSWILRTSWVFSGFGANFVKTILRLAGERAELRIVADQVGRPTYAGDLAELVARMVERRDGKRLPFGTYHAVGGAVTSWHGFAEAIVAAGVRHKRLVRAPRVTRCDVDIRRRRGDSMVARASVASLSTSTSIGCGIDSAVRRPASRRADEDRGLLAALARADANSTARYVSRRTRRRRG
jgi:dTDP-4-dehydrorhamnose reductase